MQTTRRKLLTFKHEVLEYSIGAVWQENSLCPFFLSEGSDKINGTVCFLCICDRYHRHGVSVGKPLYCFRLWPETDTRDLKRENMSLICNGNNIDVVPKTSHCNYVLRYVASFPIIPVTPFPYGDSPLKRESAF